MNEGRKKEERREREREREREKMIRTGMEERRKRRKRNERKRKEERKLRKERCDSCVYVFILYIRRKLTEECILNSAKLGKE